MTHTCGQGIAHHAALPRLMAEVVSAVGDNLDAHLTAIANDEVSRPEREAYAGLVNDHRDLAGRLRSLAQQMAGYANLPMANHDMVAMQSERMHRAFDELVSAERRLADLLRIWIDQHQQMLDASRQTGGVS
jgi:hypothetical protein